MERPQCREACFSLPWTDVWVHLRHRCSHILTKTCNRNHYKGRNEHTVKTLLQTSVLIFLLKLQPYTFGKTFWFFWTSSNIADSFWALVEYHPTLSLKKSLLWSFLWRQNVQKLIKTHVVYWQIASAGMILPASQPESSSIKKRCRSPCRSQSHPSPR